MNLFSTELVGGSFRFSGEKQMSCVVRNFNDHHIVIEALKDRVLEAKFFNANGVEIPVDRHFHSSVQGTKEWINLRSNKPKYNVGAFYSLLMYYANLPIKNRDQVEYMTFKVTVYRLTNARNLLDKKEVEVKLMHKSDIEIPPKK